MKKKANEQPVYHFGFSWRATPHYNQASIKLMYSIPRAHICVAEWIIDEADTDHPSIHKFYKYAPNEIPAEYYEYTAEQLMAWVRRHYNYEHDEGSIADRIWRDKHWDEKFFN